MALNASSKLRPKVIALQKRGVAVLLQRTEEAAESGALTEKKARETYRATVRVRTPRRLRSGFALVGSPSFGWGADSRGGL